MNTPEKVYIYQACKCSLCLFCVKLRVYFPKDHKNSPPQKHAVHRQSWFCKNEANCGKWLMEMVNFTGFGVYGRMLPPPAHISYTWRFPKRPQYVDIA
jgi:hypothetical protein